MTRRRGTAALVLAAAILLLSPAGIPAAALAAPPAERDASQSVAFGDSITWGGGFAGYPPRLEALLAAKYGTAFVWNAGIGGEGTNEGLARIDAVLAGTNSKYLLLMEGTNDASNLLISIDTVDFNLREMCRRAAAAGWTPLLATITPRSDWVWDTPLYRERIYDLNTRIRQAAADLKITLVDAFTAFMEYPASSGGYATLLFDGLHPNSLGYQLLAETWFAALKVLKFDPPAPPLQPALETRPDATETRKINVVTWQANPLNAFRALKSYLIYRKTTGATDTAFSRIGSVSASVFRYEDTALDIPTKYAYRVTALSAVLDESDPTAAVAEAAALVFPPLEPAVSTRLDATETRKINAVTWQANPLNASAALKSYLIYRKSAGAADTAFSRIGSVGASVFRYEDSGLDILTKYAYRVAAVSALLDESAPTAAVTETATFVFPPSDLSVRTIPESGPRIGKKLNIITFGPNPLNDGTLVAGYRVYRKKSGESDDRFAAIAALGASTYRVTDPFVPAGAAYVYAATALFSDGRESKKSASFAAR